MLVYNCVGRTDIIGSSFCLKTISFGNGFEGARAVNSDVRAIAKDYRESTRTSTCYQGLRSHFQSLDADFEVNQIAHLTFSIRHDIQLDWVHCFGEHLIKVVL